MTRAKSSREGDTGVVGWRQRVQGGSVNETEPATGLWISRTYLLLSLAWRQSINTKEKLFGRPYIHQIFMLEPRVNLLQHFLRQ